MGERTSTAGKPIKNRILLSIAEREFRLLRPHLEFTTWPQHRTLHEAARRLEFLGFPNSGLISLVVATEDGKTVEAGVVGSEGVLGVPAAVGLIRCPLRQVVQIAGDGFRVKVGALHTLLKAAPQFQMTLSRYAILQGMQVAQIAACNRLHDVGQRLARWLLMAQDRVETASLAITHDYLAALLGTDRPSVTLAAGILQKNGAIRYVRGVVKILNRKKLESGACECYRVIEQFHSDLRL